MIRRLAARLGALAGRGSLRLRMTLAGVVALTLGICLTTLLLVQRAERDMLRDQRERELQETARTAAIVSSRVVELQNMLRIAGEQLDAATLRDKPALERFLEDRAVLHSPFSHMAVTTPDGRVRVYAERQGVRPLSLDIGGQPYFRQTVAEGRPIVSEVLTSRVIGEPVVVFTYPLRGTQGVYGVIAGAVRLDSGDLLTHAAQYLNQDDWAAMLVVSDARGSILAHPDGRRVMTHLGDDPRLAGVWEGWRGMSSPLEPAGVSVAVPGMLASVAAVTGPEWLLWRLQPEDRLRRPLHAARGRALPAALVAIDLDRFKPINDNAGHAAGDAMLQAVAEALLCCVRGEDLAVRLGGDEFVLLLERCGAEEALAVAHRACAAVNRLELPWEGHRLRVGASAGVAMLEEGMTQPQQWMRAADQACYAAKRHGRGHARLARKAPQAVLA